MEGIRLANKLLFTVCLSVELVHDHVCVCPCEFAHHGTGNVRYVSTHSAHGQWKGKIQKIFSQCIAQICGELLRKQVTKWVSATGMFLQPSVPSFPPVLF